MEKINWTGEIRRLVSEEIIRREKSVRFATTRAVYYWLGSIGKIPLTERGYKALNALTVTMRQQSDPKLPDMENFKKGCIPWGYFPVVRGSNGSRASSYIDPTDFFKHRKDWFLGSSNYYQPTRWLDQDYHVEAWVEKRGLLSNIEYAVRGLDIQCRSVEGFPPWEFVHENLDSIKAYLDDRAEGAEFVILYLGDLDPSGRDIARQLKEALDFFGMNAELKWISVLPDQVEDYGIPKLPNDPDVIAKIHRDSRYKGYMKWLESVGIEGEMFAELDAVNAVSPNLIGKEIRPIIEDYFNEDVYRDVLEEYKEDAKKLNSLLEDAKKKLE